MSLHRHNFELPCDISSLSVPSVMAFVQDADAATTESFEWLSQLRFDFNPNAKDPTQGLTVRMADARFEYGFEYLGIGERLVQTPLTDRWVKNPITAVQLDCYMFRRLNLCFHRFDASTMLLRGVREGLCLFCYVATVRLAAVTRAVLYLNVRWSRRRC